MFKSNKIQVQIMGTVFITLFLCAISLLIVYEYELYHRALNSSRSIIRLTDSRYHRVISDAFLRVRNRVHNNQDFDQVLTYDPARRKREIQIGMRRISEEEHFLEVNFFLPNEAQISTSDDPSMSQEILQTVKEKEEPLGAFYDKNFSSFILYRTFEYKKGERAYLFALMNMERILELLVEYKHVFSENGFQQSSVFLKSEDLFLGENLKFGHFKLLRNRSREHSFELTPSGFLSMNAFSLPDGSTGYLGSIVPEYEVLQPVYKIGYLSSLGIISLFLLLFLFTYFNLKRILSPLQTAIVKIEDSTRDVERISHQNTGLSNDLLVVVGDQASNIEQSTELLGNTSAMSAGASQHYNISRDNVRQAEVLVQDSLRKVESLSRQMHQLGEFAQNMTRMVDLIKEISNKIDIVAINAAIEAARAGDRGRDFAVVSDEIARLANSSLEHSLKIERQIRESLEVIQASLGSSSEARRKLERATEQVGLASQSMNKLSEDAEQQAEKVLELTRVMMSVDRQNQRNRIVADQVTEHGRDLTQSVSDMKKISTMIHKILGENSRES